MRLDRYSLETFNKNQPKLGRASYSAVIDRLTPIRQRLVLELVENAPNIGLALHWAAVKSPVALFRCKLAATYYSVIPITDQQSPATPVGIIRRRHAISRRNIATSYLVNLYSAVEAERHAHVCAVIDLLPNFCDLGGECGTGFREGHKKA